MPSQQNTERLILVTGATGKQGGSVARHLLREGFRVRALTRQPWKVPSRALADLGAEIVQGDLDDARSLDRALEGVHGVFSVQNFWETGRDREVRQGKMLADAAKAAGVRHFVYSSVGGAERRTGIAHFDSKWEIEQHVRELNFPCWTILRPVFFMENWESYMRENILGGTLPQPLDLGKPLQQIAVDDIGAFAAIVFADPDRWCGREVELAGDELTMPEVASLLSRQLGRRVQHVQVPWDQFRQLAGEESTVMYEWFNREGYKADIPALRREYPPLKTLEQFLRDQDWLRAEAFAGVPTSGEKAT